jgi:hypothetical protein
VLIVILRVLLQQPTPMGRLFIFYECHAVVTIMPDADACVQPALHLGVLLSGSLLACVFLDGYNEQ